MRITTNSNREPHGRRAQSRYYLRREDAPIPSGRCILARITQTCAVVAFVTLFVPNNSEAFTLWDISVLIGLLSLTLLAISKLLANHRTPPRNLTRQRANCPPLPATFTTESRLQRCLQSVTQFAVIECFTLFTLVTLATGVVQPPEP